MSLGILNIGASDNDPAADSIRAGGRKLNVAPAVISRTITAPPGSPSIGAIYIVPSGATGAWSGQTNKVAYYNGSTWEFYTPAEGWRTWVAAEAVMVVFTAGAWNDSAIGGGGIGEAPNDGGYYARRNEAWEAFTPGAGGGAAAIYMRVEQNAQQAINSTTATVDFQNVVEDALSIWDSASDTAIIPSVLNGQVVILDAETQHTLDGAATLELWIERSTDGGTNWNRVAQSPNAGTDHFGICAAHAVIKVATGHRFRVRQATSSSKNTSGTFRTSFTMATLGGGGGGSGDPVPFAGFRVRKNAQQTPTAGAPVEVTWQTEDFDTEAAFNSNRFTVPAGLNGKYGAFFVGLNFTTAPTGAAALYIQRSTDGGTNWSTFCQVEFPNEAQSIGHTGPVLLTTGHVWRVVLFLNPTATLNNVDSTFFSMAVLDPGVAVGGGGATPLDLKTVSGSYTLLDADLAGNVYITADTSAGACTITVPDTLTGTEPVAIERSGANDCTLVAGGTTTIRSADGHLKLRVDASVATLVPKGSDVYTLSGDLSA